MVLKWHTYAGGVTSDKHGYSTTRYIFGYYDIHPVSSRSGRHIGYRLYFVNDKGKLPGGLWQDLGMFNSPNSAKGAAKRHLSKHALTVSENLRRPSR